MKAELIIMPICLSNSKMQIPKGITVFVAEVHYVHFCTISEQI